MRHDWNSLLCDDPSLRVTEYTEDLFPNADVLYRYLNDFAKKYQLNIRYNTIIKNISKTQKQLFQLETSAEDTLTCEVLLMATGIVKHHLPEEIAGMEHTTNYGDMVLDLDFYRNKRVAVIGGGNSGFETADYIAGKAAHVHVFLNKPLKMAWESHFVGDLRAVNNNLLDMYQLKSLHAVLKPRIKKINKLADGTLQTEHEYDFPEGKVPGTLKLKREYDYIINCTGFKYTNEQWFDESLTPQSIKNGKFYDLTATWESPNVSQLHFIGTSMQAIDRKSSSGFIHGFRYNIRTLANLLEEKHEGKKYPEITIKLDDFENFLGELYKRFSTGDGIFQLFGFLGDQLELTEDGTAMTWKKDLPIKLIQQNISPDKHTLILSLEFGFDKHSGKSSLEFLGPSDPHDTPNSAFLHPVIRHYYQGEMQEFHFGDSLLGRWDLPHSTGGAIASYHTEFYNWLANILNLRDKELKNIGENPIYEVWPKKDEQG
jgi:hypothetical protein